MLIRDAADAPGLTATFWLTDKFALVRSPKVTGQGFERENARRNTR
jgi:hypothetical protein